MGNVKFFCDCGREIWQELEFLRTDSVEELNELIVCSDCLLSKILIDHGEDQVKTSKFDNMLRGEAINYCYEHKDEYIRGFYSISEGIRQFDCLISILESGTIEPKDLPDYGME